MAESVNNKTAPDSWEDSNDDKTEGLQTSLHGLNVNAPAFVPGQNVHAPVFVPGVGFQTPSNDKPENTTESINSKSLFDFNSCC